MPSVGARAVRLNMGFLGAEARFSASNSASAACRSCSASWAGVSGLEGVVGGGGACCVGVGVGWEVGAAASAGVAAELHSQPIVEIVGWIGERLLRLILG